ncbi:MAG: alpha/beta hydrolase fold domain-containing protein [Treponema sp.]|nr:alpha/beta hydrolase fold domain-containing protein [Treponema sp.]
MAIQNDRKNAIKKLRLLTFGSKTNVDVFRAKIDEAFKTVFLPNGVERTEYCYGNVDCDILSPEIYASNRVMLYIHGGSFVGGSRNAYRGFCSSLAAKCFCRVVVPEYRLAPEFPYPAANEDIQTVFKALFTEEQIACSLNAEPGTKPRLPEIIIAADSSAASIACSLVFNLKDKFRTCVSKVVLLSPWLNLSQSSRLIATKKISDEVMSGDILRKSASLYTSDANLDSHFVSPLLADAELLKNFPPVFIQMGAREILLDDARRFCDRLVAAGNSCLLDKWPDMMFMFQMADDFLNESHLALDKIGKIITGDFAGEEAVQIQNQPRLEHSLHSEA